MKTLSRRTFLSQSANAPAILPFLMPEFSSAVQGDEFSLNEVRLLQDMTDYQYKSLWGNLKGITEKEADWKPNPESNSVRWVVGHLCWFEEWMADAIENKGRYLTDKKPMSVQEPTMEAIRTRFDAARTRSTAVVKALAPEILSKKVVFVGRVEVPISNLFQTQVTHMSGHRYQVRYIRGTYSRVFKITNKADFDPW
ncbi:DinB family protein [Spirosoma sp. BT702]|uniref:DinB family protein n=1 Tax=Spirosoma profusum TaxID=2771354 RepID=A0A926Y0M8_9BACT|nr:DinB family protein [Spirosoma profusum]MBD2701747.1 DinB family protein [Spirosoma profusum]